MISSILTSELVAYTVIEHMKHTQSIRGMLVLRGVACRYGGCGGAGVWRRGGTQGGGGAGPHVVIYKVFL